MDVFTLLHFFLSLRHALVLFEIKLNCFLIQIHVTSSFSHNSSKISCLSFFRIKSACLLWYVVLKIMDALGEEYQKIINKFNVPLNGIKHLRYGKKEARAKTCLANTVKVFGFAIARPFVEKYYDKTAKNTVSALSESKV